MVDLHAKRGLCGGDPALHRRERTAACLCDRRELEALDVAQRPRQALADRQAVERAVHLPEQRAVLGRRRGVGELGIVIVRADAEPDLPAPAAQPASR
jgi:hypothetical protein